MEPPKQIDADAGADYLEVISKAFCGFEPVALS